MKITDGNDLDKNAMKISYPCPQNKSIDTPLYDTMWKINAQRSHIAQVLCQIAKVLPIELLVADVQIP